jgi:hypothetical protein
LVKITYVDPAGVQRTWESAERQVSLDGLQVVAAVIAVCRTHFVWQYCPSLSLMSQCSKVDHLLYSPRLNFAILLSVQFAESLFNQGDV